MLLTLLFDVLCVSHGVRAKRCATSPLQGSVIACSEALGTTRIRDADHRCSRSGWLACRDEAFAAVGCHGHHGRQWFGIAVEYRTQSFDGVGTDIASVDRAGGGSLLVVRHLRAVVLIFLFHLTRTSGRLLSGPR